MTRLAIVAPHFPEYTIRYAIGMARNCPVLACVDADQLAAEYGDRVMPERDGCTIHPVRFKTPTDLARLVRLIAAWHPTGVQFQEAAGPRRGLFNSAVALAMKRTATIALTVHDPAPHAGRDLLAARRTARMSNHLRRLADIVVLHGAYCAELYQRTGYNRAQHIVESNHGVILSPSTTRVRQEGPPRFYFFGRMEAYKGVETLLLAAEQLHREGLSFQLCVAGQGPELDRLFDRFGRLPPVRVQRGFIPSAMVIASIQEADCVVLPYLSATQSGVLAAAFAGHRFVIASDIGGLPDVVEHGGNGLLVPPGDAAALADIIRIVVQNNGLRDHLRAGATRTAETRLDWDHIAAKLFDVFVGTRSGRVGQN